MTKKRRRKLDPQQLRAALNNIAFDVSREIDRTRGKAKLDPPGASHMMVSLALMAYTEFFGKYERSRAGRPNSSRKDFDAFFARMGEGYRAFLKERNVYDRIRCGLAHEYYVKGAAAFIFKKENARIRGHPLADEINEELDELRPFQVGIGLLPKTGVYFIVEVRASSQAPW